MYLGGYGWLPKDDVEARRLFSRAAEQGDSIAQFALFLEDTRIAPFVRGLPQTAHDVIFFLIIGTFCLIALAVAALGVFVIWKILRRLFPDLQIGRILWLIVGSLSLTYLLRFLPKN